jgi:hypothetical protein
MRAYLTVINTARPNINAELFLASRLEYTIRKVLCPLVVVVKIRDAVSTQTCLI